MKKTKNTTPESPKQQAQKSVKAEVNKTETKTASKDVFGVRTTSMRHKVTSILGKEPLTMKQIKEKTGSKSTNYHLLNDLVEKKLVEQNDDGFFLTAAGLALRKTK